ncbi:MAG: hypothetical protein ABJC19_08280 [Gemmatimonadota bacterium]
MRWLALMVAALALPTQDVSAQTESRWAVEIRNPATVERGELRLDRTGGRILLESADHAWSAVADLHIVDGRIRFLLPGSGRRFEGALGTGLIEGELREPDGRVLRWTAERIPEGIERWPVRPRVTVRQLLLGSGDTAVTLPGAWRSILPTSAALVAERDALARAAGLAPVRLDDLLGAQRVALGFDSASRIVAHGVVARIATGPAADDEFRRLFGMEGSLRFDLHQVAFASVAAKRTPAVLAPDVLARGLAVFAPGAPLARTQLELYAAAWRGWSRARTDTTESQMLLDAMAVRDPEAFRAVRAIFTGYDESVGWWSDAVQWLLTRKWIETASGYRSPAQLVATFWQRTPMLPPPLEPTHFGSVQAVPVIGAARLGARLIHPANAAATEWLAQGGMAEALAAWRGVDAVDSLTVVRAGTALQLTAPAVMARSRLGGFLSGRDAIRLEPGIAPIFAVVTVLHEWQHLLFEGARFDGQAPGLRESSAELQLIDGNPWLAEGAAEWATEALLAPARSSTPLLPLMEALKRGSIGLTGADDPHVLGYLLVRALASRDTNTAMLRERLIRLLHDPLALGQEYGLRGGARGVEPIHLNRPAFAAVIPEITFTWDDGVTDHLSRRLLLPTPSQEPR